MPLQQSAELSLSGYEDFADHLEDVPGSAHHDYGLSDAISDETNQWSSEEAIRLCEILEKIAPNYGCHVALTGGTLYKPGMRKDVDILFYRIRQTPQIERTALLDDLSAIGIAMTSKHGWVQKAIYKGKSIDFFFPDHIDEPGACGEYA